MVFNGRAWFWIKVGILVFYVLVLLLKVIKCYRLRKVANRFSSVAPEAPTVSKRDSERSTLLEEVDKYDSDVAYATFTRLVAPFCMFTTALSLLQDNEDVPSSLTVGGSNAFPLFISTILLLAEHRPQFNLRLRIWLALALWFLATQLSFLLIRELRLDENMWLNHMVFLTIISSSLQLPRLLIWISAVLHSAGFLTLTLVIGEEDGPSLGLQIFMFAVLLMSAHYASILSRSTMERLSTALEIKDVKLRAQRYEVDTAVAQALAHEEALRAQAAEARADALSDANETVMNLLRSICDAIVQVDENLKILNDEKLGLLLYQNSQDLAGTFFTDLLGPLERQQFQVDLCASKDGGQGPILSTLRGSYDAKIRVAIYVSVLPQSDGQVKYFLGLTEDEEKLEEMSQCSSIPGIKSPVNTCNMLQRLEALQEAAEVSDPTDPKSEELEEPEEDQSPGLLEFLEEERMQALMSFLWTWPGAKDSCCTTHDVLDKAQEALTRLQQMPCSASSSHNFTWQCPACKLMGFECDKALYDKAKSTCGRCVNWESLY